MALSEVTVGVGVAGIVPGSFPFARAAAESAFLGSAPRAAVAGESAVGTALVVSRLPAEPGTVASDSGEAQRNNRPKGFTHKEVA